MENKANPPICIAREPILTGVRQIKVIEKSAEQVFYIAEALLKKHAPEFPPELHEMHDISIKTLEIFVTWLNERETRSEHWHGPLYFLDPLFSGDPNPFIATLSLIKTFNLGLAYNVPQLRKDACTLLSSCVRDGLQNGEVCEYALAVEAVKYTYQNTERGSTLQLIMVDAFCTTNLSLWSSLGWLQQLPNQFLADIIHRKAELQGHKESEKDARKEMTQWSIHGEENGKKRKKVDSDAQE